MFILFFLSGGGRYVRQGVLFALSMVVVSTPILPTGLEGGLTEAVHWVEGMCTAQYSKGCEQFDWSVIPLLQVCMRVIPMPSVKV